MQKPSEMPLKTTHTGHYEEMWQSYAVKFAWAIKEKDHWLTQHTWVKCRDFLGDLLVLNKEKNFEAKIYNLSLPENFKETNYLAVHFPDPTYITKFCKNISELYQIENKNNIPNTEFIIVDDNNVIITVPDYWMQSNVTLSLYTFLIKIFSYSKDNYFEEADPTSAEYVMSLGDNLPKLLDNLKNLKFPNIHKQYQTSKSLKNFHNNTGFVSHFSKTYKQQLLKDLVAL